MTDSPTLPRLTVAEARALGTLVEKEATTPDAYPLTINAVLVASNQKTARDPVLALSQGEVQHALRTLEAQGLARQVFSTRAERYEHRLGSALDLTRQQLALLGLLLLRGPQTLHELLSRGERLAELGTAEDVRHQLERLLQRAEPPILLLPRAPGQREDRYVHLLSGPVDAAAIAASLRSGTMEDAAGRAAPGEALQALEARVAALEASLAELLARD